MREEVEEGTKEGAEEEEEESELRVYRYRRQGCRDEASSK